MHLHMYIRTYIHTYIHTCIHPYMRSTALSIVSQWLQKKECSEKCRKVLVVGGSGDFFSVADSVIMMDETFA